MQNQSVIPNSATFVDIHPPETLVSGVSWGAIFAGATAAAALSLILVILGFGLGLSAVSPWSYSVAAIGTSTILWLAFTQLAASGIGGYIAGSLRVKWGNLHTDEVHYRDTAHGLLAWAVASLMMAVLLGGLMKDMLGGAAEVAAGATGAAAVATASAASDMGNGNNSANANAENNLANPMTYFTDMVLRTNSQVENTVGSTSNASGTSTSTSTNNASVTNANANNSDAVRNSVMTVFATSMVDGKLSPEDRTYLAQIVAKRTGLSEAEAAGRIDNIYARLTQTVAKAKQDAKVMADKARKAAAKSALWMFVGLLIGAFVASLSATFGGRKRDRAVVHVRPLA